MTDWLMYVCIKCKARAGPIPNAAAVLPCRPLGGLLAGVSPHPGRVVMSNCMVCLFSLCAHCMWALKPNKQCKLHDRWHRYAAVITGWSGHRDG